MIEELTLYVNNKIMEMRYGDFKNTCIQWFFIILGVIVWKKNIIDFIAGCKKDSIHNPKKLAKNIGLIIILFGIEIGILMLCY